jgi:hypothetical protein
MSFNDLPDAETKLKEIYELDDPIKLKIYKDLLNDVSNGIINTIKKSKEVSFQYKYIIKNRMYNDFGHLVSKNIIDNLETKGYKCQSNNYMWTTKIEDSVYSTSYLVLDFSISIMN